MSMPGCRSPSPPAARATLRLGTMLTPLPRRKPWELAGQVATVDRLSNGRVIVSVGLGAPDSGYEAFGEETDKVRPRRAARRGPRHRPRPVGRATVLPPRQALHDRTERLPGDRPHARSSPACRSGASAHSARSRSMNRALSCDGLIPQVVEDGKARQCTLEELQHVQLPRPPIRRDRRGGVERALPCRVGRGRRDMVAGDACGRAVSDPDALDASMSRLRQGPPRESLD